MQDLIFRAMMFARDAHKGQVRKYSGNPYHDHLAEVAGIVATVRSYDADAIATAWLHDTIEDCGVTYETLVTQFGKTIADGVLMLSDLEIGDRETRKRLSRERLAKANGWIQDIKCADMISNTSSIATHDPKFAQVYLGEKRDLLEVLTKASSLLRGLAQGVCTEARETLSGTKYTFRTEPDGTGRKITVYAPSEDAARVSANITLDKRVTDVGRKPPEKWTLYLQPKLDIDQ